MKQIAIVAAFLVTSSAVVAQDMPKAKSANLTGAGAAGCVESTLPRGCMLIPSNGMGSVLVRLSGTWAGTVVAEGSVDGATDPWIALDITKLATGAWTLVANTTANANFLVPAGGFKAIRIRASLYTSGTVVVDAWASPVPFEPIYSRDASGNMVVSGTVTVSEPVSVEGNAADGAAVSGTPVRVGGKDGAGLTQDILTDTGGAVQVDVESIAGGTNNVGDVDVDSFPAAAIVNAEQAAKTSDVTLIAAAANTRLVFAQCAETAAVAAAATVILRHGEEAAGSCSGNYVARIELAPNETGDPLKWDARGLAVASGVCMDITAGTVDCWSASVVETAP